MSFPIRLKFAAGYLLIALLAFLFIAIPGKQLSVRQSLKKEVNRLYKDAYYLSASYKAYDGSISQTQLETMAYASGTEIWIIDRDGTLCASSGNTDVPERTSFDPAAGKEGHYMIGDFYGWFDADQLSVYTSLTMNISSEGYVILHYPMETLRSEADQRILLCYLIYAIFVVLLLLSVIPVEFFIIHPLLKTDAAAREYANGNLSYPTEIRQHDEFRSLSLSILELVRRLNSNTNDQHKFLANISHDFRSPLTSVRGYLVAIQDGTIPPEMQGKYIDIVINETERLTKLANGLLDITQLESGIMLDKSVFDINDLIRSVLDTFEGRVEDKGISFNVTFEETHQGVKADRQRIQQVLYNLVDNAIKFSNSGTTIDLAAHLHGDKVFVSVTDHGVGIEKENLNKIWERFYKTDTSRGKDKKGTGLGLSIVREIIQAHKEHIDVISTPGVGTEFIFTLPRAALKSAE